MSPADTFEGSGARDELHRTDGPVEAGACPRRTARVGVPHHTGVRPAVQPRPEDPRTGYTRAVQPVSGVLAVVGLDPPDGSQQGPEEMAGRVGKVDHDRGTLIGEQRLSRDRAHGPLATRASHRDRVSATIGRAARGAWTATTTSYAAVARGMSTTGRAPGVSAALTGTSVATAVAATPTIDTPVDAW